MREVEITLAGKALGKDAMRQLAAVLERHPGDRRVSFVVEVNGAGPRAARPRRHGAPDPAERSRSCATSKRVCGAGSVVLK